jgi:hypothetical protein
MVIFLAVILAQLMMVTHLPMVICMYGKVVKLVLHISLLQAAAVVVVALLMLMKAVVVALVGI